MQKATNPLTEAKKTRVFKGQNLRAICYHPERPRLLVCFDHLRMDRTGFPNAKGGLESLEKYGCGDLNVQTSENDWFLNDDLPLLRRALNRFTSQYDCVTANGFSMGGYAALLLAADLKLSYATLISPQYSIQKYRAPFEKRYEEEVKHIKTDEDQLDFDYARSLKGSILYDPLWHMDRMHKVLICNDFPNITPVPLWAGGHPSIKIVAARNKWSDFLEEMAKPEPNAKTLIRFHKSLRRGYAPYKKAMNNHLSARKHSILNLI